MVVIFTGLATLAREGCGCNVWPKCLLKGLNLDLRVILSGWAGLMLGKVNNSISHPVWVLTILRLRSEWELGWGLDFIKREGVALRYRQTLG